MNQFNYFKLLYILVLGALFKKNEGCLRAWIPHQINDYLLEHDKKMEAFKNQQNYWNRSLISLFFLCDRLGKEKLFDDEIFDYVLTPFYTDEIGCYQPGLADEYKGKRSRTASGKKCEKWDIIVWELKRQIEIFENVKKKIEKENQWPKKKINFSLDKYINLANQTIKEMKEKDILHHNYCRDPDQTGVPWCYVRAKNQILWEPCNVPKCTSCWHIRFKSKSAEGLVNNLWSPYCHLTEGYFLPLQCYKHLCWCSEKNGTLVKGTVKNTNFEGMPDCGKKVSIYDL